MGLHHSDPVFYNRTDWVETLPAFTPEQVSRLTRGTDGSLNVCLEGHLVPEVLVIGAMKAGTTSFCTALAYSPSMDFPRWDGRTDNRSAAGKEGNYFDEHFDMGVPFMTKDFGLCDQTMRKVAVDGTARYSNDQNVPRHLVSWYGPLSKRVKLVLLMREPLARMHSHYHHGRRVWIWCHDFRQMWFREIVTTILSGSELAGHWMGGTLIDVRNCRWCHDFIEGSLYTNSIGRYFEYFAPSQFTFIPFLLQADEALRGNAPHPAQTLWDKLGVNGLPPPNTHTNNGHHSSLEHDLTLDQIAAMREWFAERTSPRMIAELLAGTDADLYAFESVFPGQPRDIDTVAQWIKGYW